MDKLGKIFEIAEPFFRQKLNGNLKTLAKGFNDNRKDISNDFADRIKNLYAMAAQHQREASKNPVSFLYIAYLRSSLITKTYDCRLSLHNEDLYMDPVETCGYWKPGFLFGHMEQDMKELQTILMGERSIGHVSDFDVKEVEYSYAHAHMFTAVFFMGSLIKDTLEKAEAESWEAPVFSDGFAVVFGGHMENAYEIYPNYTGPKIPDEVMAL